MNSWMYSAQKRLKTKPLLLVVINPTVNLRRLLLPNESSYIQLFNWISILHRSSLQTLNLLDIQIRSFADFKGDWLTDFWELWIGTHIENTVDIKIQNCYITSKWIFLNSSIQLNYKWLKIYFYSWIYLLLHILYWTKSWTPVCISNRGTEPIS